MSIARACLVSLCSTFVIVTACSSASDGDLGPPDDDSGGVDAALDDSATTPLDARTDALVDETSPDTRLDRDTATAPETSLTPDTAAAPDTNIVADAPSPAGARKFTFVNRCTQTVWVGALVNGGGGFALPEHGGWELPPGSAHAIGLSDHWGGRFWGRTECAFDATGKGACATGDCGNRKLCDGAGGKPPASLAEFLTSGDGGKDFYDVSLVDGYNLPIAITPDAGTFTKSSATDAYDCGAPACTGDLNVTCPPELQQKDGAGKVVACLSACEKFGTDEYCCKGAHSTPSTCPPTSYSKTFKAACPSAYSYAYDDHTSTFTCKGRDYTITFCP